MVLQHRSLAVKFASPFRNPDEQRPKPRFGFEKEEQMKQSIINRTISLTALVALIAVVPGCSPGVDGDYTGAGGMMTVELHGGRRP